jgi:hypothetical protein
LLSPTYEDEESVIPGVIQRSVTAPLNPSVPLEQASSSYGTLRTKKSPQLPSTQSSSRKSPGALRVSRLRRAKTAVIPEAEEIWGELEEDSPSSVVSPFSARRRSLHVRTPTPSKLRPQSGDSGLESSQELPPLTPNEQTGLLARSSTGRNYRDRRRRQPSGNRDSEARSQDAIGGWWKMKRWWKRDKNSKGKSTTNNGADNA